MEIAKPKKTNEIAKSDDVVCNPPSFQPVKIYNPDGAFVKVWDPEVLSYEVFCGDIDYAVPLYKDEELDPPNKEDWTQVKIADGQNGVQPFSGLWGYYKVLSKTDLN